MTTFARVSSLLQLQSYMGLFREGFDAMEKHGKVFETEWGGFVQTLVGVLNTYPENGIVVVEEDGQAVGYGVGFDDTPPYASKKVLLLWALYVKPSHSKVLAPQLFEHACELGRDLGYDMVTAFNGRFSGASFRFFEQTLGMRRKTVKFTKDL